ncbi:MAG: alpha/beta hydrolase domain-containing protein, partial [Acidobacteriota bacterium]
MMLQRVTTLRTVLLAMIIVAATFGQSRVNDIKTIPRATYSDYSNTPGVNKTLSATPIPHITGPIPVTKTSHPFGAAEYQRVPEYLHKIGYVEEEYFVSGTSNVYEWSEVGIPVVRTPNAPYTTRVLIRRPASKARFSGNAVVEMLNPSN